MNREVKGTLFADYVRMIRCHKDVDWESHLQPEDLPFLEQQIELDQWYPMKTFERFGSAIFTELAQGDLEAAHAWGQRSVDELSGHHEGLIVEGDPRESMMRVKVLRASFFNFDPVEFLYLSDGEARLRVNYGMGNAAEEAACHQTLGFFERLLSVAGARQCQASLASRAWHGDPETILELHWR